MELVCERGLDFKIDEFQSLLYRYSQLILGTKFDVRIRTLIKLVIFSKELNWLTVINLRAFIMVYHGSFSSLKNLNRLWMDQSPTAHPASDLDTVSQWTEIPKSIINKVKSSLKLNI